MISLYLQLFKEFLWLFLLCIYGDIQLCVKALRLFLKALSNLKYKSESIYDRNFKVKLSYVINNLSIITMLAVMSERYIRFE